jgi:hypothetical protein
MTTSDAQTSISKFLVTLSCDLILLDFRLLASSFYVTNIVRALMFYFDCVSIVSVLEIS